MAEAQEGAAAQPAPAPSLDLEDDTNPFEAIIGFPIDKLNDALDRGIPYVNIICDFIGTTRGIVQFINKNIDSITSLSRMGFINLLFKLITFHMTSYRKRLPQYSTFDSLIHLLKTRKKVLVLTGAGISTSCGIMDFRSKNGVYSMLGNYPLEDPTDLFSISYFKRNVKPFYHFARKLWPGTHKPAPTHYFIKELENQNILLRNYTQNIDTLENEAGLKTVLQCHGSFATATCTRCKYKCDGSVIRNDILNGKIPLCPVCKKNPMPSLVPDDDNNSIANFISAQTKPTELDSSSSSRRNSQSSCPPPAATEKNSTPVKKNLSIAATLSPCSSPKFNKYSSSKKSGGKKSAESPFAAAAKNVSLALSPPTDLTLPPSATTTTTETSTTKALHNRYDSMNMSQVSLDITDTSAAEIQDNSIASTPASRKEKSSNQQPIRKGTSSSSIENNTTTTTSTANDDGAEEEENDEDDDIMSKLPLVDPYFDRGIMKPDITFFGEDLSDHFYNQIKIDVDECDLLLVLGTSLKVAPVSQVIEMVDPEKCPQILINREVVARPHQFDIELLGNCDDVVVEIAKQLNWTLPKSNISVPVPSSSSETSYTQSTIEAHRYLFNGAVEDDSDMESNADSEVGDKTDETAEPMASSAASADNATAAAAVGQKRELQTDVSDEDSLSKRSKTE